MGRGEPPKGQKGGPAGAHRPCAPAGQKDNRPPDRFQLTFPLRTNYMYAKVKKSLPEMYAFSICMWIKSSASPGMGTPFSYAVPGQANELVLIEWGNNPMEILINDKVRPRGAGRVLGWGGSVGTPVGTTLTRFPPGGQAALHHQRRQVAPHLCDLDHAGRRVGSLPGWHPDGQRREPGPVPSHQTAGRAGAGPGAGKGWGGCGGALLAWWPRGDGRGHPATLTAAPPQDTLGGGFDATQAFVGELAHFNVWDRKLSPGEVYGLATCSSKALAGNVIAWAEANIDIYGGATKWTFEACRQLN